MNLLQAQIGRDINSAINSAINDNVIPEMQNMVGSLPSKEHEFRTSTCYQGLGDRPLRTITI